MIDPVDLETIDPRTRKRAWQLYEQQVAWENLKVAVEAEIVIPIVYTLARWRMRIARWWETNS